MTSFGGGPFTKEMVEIGSRIILVDENERATVQYVGPVDNHKGVWLGVDWDNAKRGKHNGTVDGKKYFEAKSNSSGSFVRESKVSLGVSFLDAVRERYGDRVDSDTSFAGQLMGTKEIEFVGMDVISEKQNKLENLSHVSVSWMTVSRVSESVQDLSSVLKSCADLNLSKNLLWDWSGLFLLVRSLPKLTALNISQNRFRAITDKDKLDDKAAGSRVTSLIMNDCHLDWEQVVLFIQNFPFLIELGLCKNQVRDFDAKNPMDVCPCVEWLDLEHNPLSEWTQVEKLGRLPHLKWLNMTAVGLDRLAITGSDCFPSLETLYLWKNEISDWASINSLRYLKCLDSLLLSDNPIMKTTKHIDKETARQFVIAKLPQIKSLDREMITPSERRGAEIDYLKYFQKDWIQSGGDRDLTKDASSQDFINDHPRFLILAKKYGSPEEPSDFVNLQSGMLKNQLIQVNFLKKSMQPVQKKLPLNMSIQKVKALAGRLCKMNPRSMTLSYESLSRPGVFIHLDNDQKDLIFYCVAEGDTIHVS